MIELSLDYFENVAVYIEDDNVVIELGMEGAAIAKIKIGLLTMGDIIKQCVVGVSPQALARLGLSDFRIQRVAGCWDVREYYQEDE